jgi:hypothetical protein
MCASHRGRASRLGSRIFSQFGDGAEWRVPRMRDDKSAQHEHLGFGVSPSNRSNDRLVETPRGWSARAVGQIVLWHGEAETCGPDTTGRSFPRPLWTSKRERRLGSLHPAPPALL